MGSRRRPIRSEHPSAVDSPEARKESAGGRLQGGRDRLRKAIAESVYWTDPEEDSTAAELDPSRYLSPKRLAARGLHSLLSAVSALYLAAVLGHWVLNPTLPHPALVVLAGAGAALLIVFRYMILRTSMPVGWSEWIGLAVALLIIASSFSHVYFVSDQGIRPFNLALLGLGSACFFFPTRRLATYIFFAIGVEVVFAWTGGPTRAWLHFSYGMFGAAGFRIYTEMRRLRLEQALEMASVQLKRRKRTENQLRESRERYALIARGTNDGLWDWDLRTDKIFFSQRWKGMLGYADDEVGNDPSEWFDRLDPADRERVEAVIARHLSGESPHCEIEYRIRNKDDKYRWALCRGVAVRDDKGHAYRIAGSQTDITAAKAAEERLVHDALHDELTGLPNRAYLLERLRAVAAGVRRSQRPFAVLFLDLDRFKIINDSLGHAMGDALLRSAAQRLKGSVRPGDMVARLGGDEFAVILPEVNDHAEAMHIASRLLDAMRKPFDIQGKNVYSSASLGVIVGRDSSKLPEDLLRDADTAMYRAKFQGTGRCELFDETMHTEAVRALQLENDLRRGVDANEMRLLYQPIVSLADKRIVGAEALLRWNHPVNGVLAPQDFLATAEETGLIIPIGWWTLDEAARQAKRWNAVQPDKPPVPVSVNLSSRQFAQPDLLQRVEGALLRAGLHPEAMRIEVNEQVLLNNPSLAAPTLTAFRDRGIGVYLDDFGTGYSSLSCLKELPIAASKLDRELVDRFNQPNSRRVVEAIVDLLHNLGIDIVAEGIETEEQLDNFSSLKCQFGQGYLFSKPVEGDEIVSTIQRLNIDIPASVADCVNL